jgi:hypothetical protein
LECRNVWVASAKLLYEGGILLINRNEVPVTCPIGYSCYEETLSVSLNYYDELYLALKYNIPLFIYDYESIIKFHFEKSPEEYLFANNVLLFNNINLPIS